MGDLTWHGSLLPLGINAWIYDQKAPSPWVSLGYCTGDQIGKMENTHI
jgi:hypothetical protein